MVNVRGPWIGVEDLPEDFQPCSPDLPCPRRDDPDRQHLLDALRICRWNKAKAARQLQWSRMTLYRKMAKFQIADLTPEHLGSGMAPARAVSSAPGERLRSVS